MPKQTKAHKNNAIPMVSEKFRTTPIKSTITRISGLPKSAILYRCEASSYWQFRVFMEGKQRKRSTKQEELATQFTALLEIAGLRQDAEGKPRTLYSLRHTAIVHSIHKGLPLEMIAANARTSSEMIRRFYGSHVKSVLYMGSAFVEAEEKVRKARHELVADENKEIGIEFDG